MIRSFEFERYASRGYFTHLNALTKMSLLSFMTMLLIMIDQTEMLIGINLMIVMIFLFSGLTIRLKLVGIGIAMLSIYSLVLSQSLFYDLVPRTLFFNLGEIDLSFTTIPLNFWYEGMIYGLKMSLRMTAPFLLSYLLFFTTSPHEFLEGLKRLRLSDGFSIMILTALRFIPYVFENYQIIRTSEKLKGYRLSFKRPIASIKTEIKLCIPVFFASVRNARMISIAMIGRQVNFDTKQSYHDPLPIKDRVLISSFALIFLIVISLKLIYWAYQYDVYYSENLREIYAFTRQFL